jgi:hypothetical protein
MEFEAVIGLEVHAEMQTQSKMFCSCRVVDATQVNQILPFARYAPACPAFLPVINQQAVEYALRVALALDCKSPIPAPSRARTIFTLTCQKATRFRSTNIRWQSTGGCVSKLAGRARYPHPARSPGRRYRQTDPCAQ